MTVAPSSATFVPAHQWRMLSSLSLRREQPRGLDTLWRGAEGIATRLRKTSGSFLARAERIAAIDSSIGSLTGARFAEELKSARLLYRAGRDAPSDLDRAFALIREAARRSLGLHPFPVQIAGALAIADGCIAEMATGEGKTLAAVLPAVVRGWRGRGVHVVTANDYLAQRDAEWMRPLYTLCGVTVGSLAQDTPIPLRREAWYADVTYCTSKEAAADFLRDRLRFAAGGVRDATQAMLRARDGAMDPSLLVTRGLDTAIIDEADSLLIDEAVTPLIISGQSRNAEATGAYSLARVIAEELKEGEHFRADRARRDITLTRAGAQAGERLAANVATDHPGASIIHSARRREELVVQALAAREFFRRDHHYIVEDSKIVIVDDATGRRTPDRTWREGLHQAVEAREGVTIRGEQETLARISFQRYFRLYRHLGGMTGTAREDAAELWQVYRLPVVAIPTNRPSIREVLPPLMFATAEAKWRAAVEEAREAREAGRAVLLGVRTVEQASRLGMLLTAAGIEHQVLSAVHHAEEAAIVARAGEAGRVTVATNMAGRGTDIRLAPSVAANGGLHVISAELNESARLERQLFGRGARQGDSGSARSLASLEDEAIFRYAPVALRAMAARLAGSEGVVPAFLAERITRAARRVVGRLGRSSRRSVAEQDHWLEESLAFAGEGV
ncbi:MAG TPA: hypothetical protein VG797_02370 [Phycisphaerales bacterium]|nr:hypothetical protein [Phycisphaerales bacterium]